MEGVSALLSSVFCNRCNNPLISKLEEDGLVKYRCKCHTTKRALLVCPHCNKQFLLRPYLLRKTNYCCLDCYWTGTNRKQLRICKICGKEFHAKAYLLKKGYGFYCGMKCWFTLFRQQRVHLKCKECKKEFTVPQSVYEQRDPKFCSKKCADDNMRDYVTRICKGCKQKFELPQFEINRGRGLFCTWKCFKHYDGETSIERIVRLQLQRLKEHFKQEYKIGRYYADFYLPDRNLIIECDGEYWHRVERIRDRDQRKDNYLQEHGYKILRLNEDFIRQDDGLLAKSILDFSFKV